MAKSKKSPEPSRQAPPQPAGAEPKGYAAWALALVALALILRFTRLMANFPVVGDESIYLRWAEIIDHQGNWFISLLDGKQPLSYWIYALERMVWDTDPLFLGRLVSIVAGGGSTWFLYRIGRQLDSAQTGLIAAGLYAVLPWAVLYDRLMYTEALVNFAGIVLAYAALRAFEPALAYRRALIAGLVLGLGFFLKSTILLLAHVPLWIAVWKCRRDQLKQASLRLAVIYGVAALFPLWCAWAVPDAPLEADYSVIFHKTHFFSSSFAAAGANAAQFLSFAAAYLTWIGMAAALLCLGLLARLKPGMAAFLAGASLLPIVLEILLIDRHYSRYAMPYLWPLLIAIASCYGVLRRQGRHSPAYALLAFAAASFAVRTIGVIFRPQQALAETDVLYYFSDAPNAGYGVNQAAAAIFEIARREGRTLVLTDPIWGTPADAIITYVNQRGNVEAREAWWAEQDRSGPLLPGPGVEVWKSHYERVSDGPIRFDDYAAILYVTLTNYRSEQEVAARAPGGRLELSVPKPGGRQSLNLYRLR